ncbi:hypothetical protein U6A24_13650 [Aquimarina gracilis]|uniref:Oxidase n=1 Tax=Aquimarina gracilis TaxID=874422 RepID=A0ABU5ZXD0_9FLAO|nr:hypothetical protein [Aquimarina gracilis]MEB3346517.1 hypothetical protein [Aquimarina gracilis]
MKDFLIEEDIIIEEGDFKIGESDQQHISHILLAQKGEYKEHPLLGVGIERYLKGDNTINRLRLEAEVEKQLTYDGFNVKVLDVSDMSNITIDGNYLE